MIKDSLHFEYADETSEEHGLINVNIEQGMISEPFVSEIELIEEIVRGTDKPYFKKTRKRPLVFSVSFAFEEAWNNEKIREVARWLTQHEIYQPLRFYTDYTDIDDARIFFALVVENSEIVHNCLKEGYVTLTMRCDSPWSYLPTVVVEDTGNKSITLSNDGDLKLLPKIQITKTTSTGSLSIVNYENESTIEFFNKRAANGFLKFTGTVYDGETIEIGDEIYEFDTGDGDVDEYEHILVDVSSDSEFATATLNFTPSGYIKESDTITIGNDIYEFDVDGVYRSANIQVDISDEVAYASGVLTLNSNPNPYDQIVIGNTRYIYDIGTNKNLIKTTNHGVDARGGYFGIINRSFKTDNNKLNFRFVEAVDRDFLKLVYYGEDAYDTSNNPFENPDSYDDELVGQQPEDVIEIYNSKFEGEITSSTNFSINTSDTQGLRTGDVLGIELDDGSLEFTKIKAVSNNNSMTFDPSVTGTKVKFFGFNRIALRVAEGPRFEIPNIVVIGADKEESAQNLANAINLEGVPSLDFGVNLKENLLVEADIDDYELNQIILTSKFAGSEGNVIVTTVSDGMDASFTDNKLTGGQDCSVSVAITKLIEAIEQHGVEKIDIVSSDSNTINFRYAIAGTVGNGIIALANAEDAEWVKEYFEGGKDPDKSVCISALIGAITSNSSVVTAELYEYTDDTIEIEHKEEGRHTNIPVRSNVYNAFWSSRKLSGGRDELEIGEIVFIDCARQQIESDKDDSNRYDCFNDEFIELELGENEVIIDGDCNIKFWLQPRTIQG